MALQGTAFLAIWHDIEPALLDDFHRWHTEEHMPERVQTPGIVVGSRYWDPQAPEQRCFTLYEATAFEVFASEGYFMTANARSPWTQRVHPGFRHFTRAPCHLACTRGPGSGGGRASLRLGFVPTGPAEGMAPADLFRMRVRALAEDAMAAPGVTGAHVGLKGQVARRPLSASALSLRPGADAFDAVLLLEGISRAALAPVADQLAATLAGWRDAVAGCTTGLYDLAYRLPASTAP